MIFYLLFAGRSYLELAHRFGTDDPFGLEPRTILERVIAAGYAPAIERPRTVPWPSIGMTMEVTDYDGRMYLVTVGRNAEEIVAQEMRPEPYDLC